jgi:hypothetical protein
MKKLISVLLLVQSVLFTFNSFSQEPGIRWTKLYKPISQLGIVTAAAANDGLQTSDGGYLAVGLTMNPYLKGYLVRTNSSGDTVWTRQYFDDVTNYGSFTCTDIEKATDNNYFISGYGTKAGIPGVIWLVKVNTNGDTLWTRYFHNYPEDLIFVTHDMKVTPDGGVIIIGDTKQDISVGSNAFIVKFTADGTFQWYRKFGASSIINEGFSIENAWDGGYLLGCLYDSIGINQLRLIKTNDSGNYEWSVIYATIPENINDWPCIIRTSDNKYAIAAESQYDYFLMKIEQNGSVIWYQTYGYINSPQTPSWVDETSDGGFIITGEHTPDGETEPQIYLVKTNSTGDIEWSKLIDVHYNDCGFRIRHTSDGGYILFGYTRTDPDDLDFLMMMKLGGTNSVADLQANNIFLSQNFPNPFDQGTLIQYFLPVNQQVSLKVFDIHGGEVAVLIDQEQAAGIHSCNFTGQSLSPGTYYYQLKTGQGCTTKKMIVTR